MFKFEFTCYDALVEVHWLLFESYLRQPIFLDSFGQVVLC